MKTPLLLAGLLVLALSCSGMAARPNVVLVMADDQGWGDTSYNGHPELKTPNLDELAKSGLRFNRFYAGHFNCSPTRGSVMTGRNPMRYGTFGPGAPIRPQEVTIAQVLKDAGYATGHFGKWHLNGKNGDRNTKDLPGRAVLASDPLNPGRMGFDEWISADNFFDLDPVLGRQGVPEKFHGDGSDIVTTEALKFIERQAGASKPFLAVVWFGNPHTPHEALPEDKAAYAKLPAKDADYYGELTAIDRNVGKLRQALRKLNVAENTIFWYCSDNGGDAGPKSTGQLRGSKGTMWEGGLRVPGVVEWPARIPKPSTTELPAFTSDIFPTICAATGAAPKHAIAPLDGIDLLPLFDGKMTAREKPLAFWANSRTGGHAVLIDGSYKLHLDPRGGRGKGKRQGEAAAAEALPRTLLYDVDKDRNETRDLAAAEPERVAKMTATLEAWQASVKKSLAGGDYK